MFYCSWKELMSEKYAIISGGKPDKNMTHDDDE